MSKYFWRENMGVDLPPLMMILTMVARAEPGIVTASCLLLEVTVTCGRCFSVFNGK